MATFTINLAKSKPKPKTTTKKSKRMFGVVIDDDGVLKCRIQTNTEDEDIQYEVLPFTDMSFDLKNKTHVFLKNRDKYGKRVCILRNKNKAVLYSGQHPEFKVLDKGLLISGYIITIDNKRYFDYDKLVAFHELGAHINEIQEDE